MSWFILKCDTSSQNPFIWAGGYKESGGEMTVDKGRLLLAEDKMHAAFRRMNGGWLIAFVWAGGVLLLLGAWVFSEEAVDIDNIGMLIAWVPGVLLIVSGVVGAYLNAKIRTISLHENGIDNLRVSYTTSRFAGFDEVESADVSAESADAGSTKDRAWMLFWVKGRRPDRSGG
jgi:hypothetical protein